MNICILSLDQSLVKPKVYGDTLERFKAYSKKVNHIKVLVPTTNSQATGSTIKNLDIEPVNTHHQALSYLKLFQKVVALSKDVDIVVTNDPVLGSIAEMSRVATRENFKIQINVFGLHVHNKFWLADRWQNRFWAKIHTWMFTRADSIRTDNHRDKLELVKDLNITSEKIVVVPLVPSPRTIKRFTQAKKDKLFKQRYAKKKKLIISVGNLFANKDFSNLIQAARDITKDHQTQFLIVGEGPLKKTLQKQILQLGLENNVSLIGGIGYDRLPEIYASADAYVLSSYQEGFPRVLMEAAFSKLPIVTTNIQGSTEIITNNQSGKIVPVRSPKKLAQAIEYILENPKTAKEFSQKAYRNAVQLLNFTQSIEAITQSWDKLHPKTPRSETIKETMKIPSLPYKPTILFISTDPSFCDVKSNTYQRHQKLAEFFEHLYVIVTNQQASKNLDKISDGKLTIIPTNSASRWLYPKDVYTVTKKISKNTFIDLVSADNPFVSGVNAFVVRLLTGAHVNIQVHNDFFSQSFWKKENLQNKVYFHLAKKVLPKADSIRTVSPTITNSLNGLTQNSIETQTIPVFPHLSDQTRLANKKTIDLIAVGRLAKQKDFMTLLKALNDVKKSNVSFTAKIVGEGPERTLLERYISDNELSDFVELVGKKTHSETLELVSRAKIFVQSSRYEGTSIALMEAMRLKKTIIATKVSGALTLIEPSKNGILVSVGSSKVLVVAIQKLLSDTKLRNRLASNAKKTIDTFLSNDPLESWARFLANQAFKVRQAQEMKQKNIHSYNSSSKEIEKSKVHPSKLVYNQIQIDWLAKNIPPNATCIDIGGGAGYVISQVAKGSSRYQGTWHRYFSANVPTSQ